MTRRRLVPMTALVVVLLLPGMALAAVDVTVDDRALAFDPERVTRPAGVAVTWHKTGGFHNVASVDGMFRSGPPTSSSFTYTRTFSSGSYRYVCEVHPSQMRGVIRVRPRVRAAPEGLPFTVRWATPATNTGSAFTVRYRVADGSWRTWKRATTAKRAVFGRGGDPVRVRAGTLYSFRVKSLDGDSSSRYSPVRRFRP
jgi:plastocyanin